MQVIRFRYFDPDRGLCGMSGNIFTVSDWDRVTCAACKRKHERDEVADKWRAKGCLIVVGVVVVLIIVWFVWASWFI